jgi:hypothetical protein
MLLALRSSAGSPPTPAKRSNLSRRGLSGSDRQRHPADVVPEAMQAAIETRFMSPSGQMVVYVGNITAPPSAIIGD